MHSSPGYSKPEHQYGESFGDQAQVLDGVDLSPFATLTGLEPGEVPDLGGVPADGEFGGQLEHGIPEEAEDLGESAEHQL